MFRYAEHVEIQTETRCVGQDTGVEIVPGSPAAFVFSTSFKESDMEFVIILGIVAAIAYGAYKSGKRTGSRKGYGAAMCRRRRSRRFR